MPSKSNGSARNEYLHEYLGVDFDPFSSQRAERELKVPPRQFGDDNPPQSRFYQYIIEPVDGLMSDLQKNEHAFLFGERGSGKTTLRFFLEGQIRTNTTLNATTLVISPTFNESQTLDNMWGSLCRALAHDMFIQTIEEIVVWKERVDGNHDLLIELAQFSNLADLRFNRRIKRLLSTLENKSTQDWFSQLNRPIIHKIPFTDSLIAFIHQLQKAISQADTLMSKDKELFQDGLRLAQKLGYETIFLLLDSEDSFDETQITQIVDIFLHRTLMPMPVYVKWFLSTDLENMFRELVPKDVPHKLGRLEWSENKLRELVRARLSSGNSIIDSIIRVAHPEIVEHLESDLFKFSKRDGTLTPRLLLGSISTLIDIHAQKELDDYRINAQDWDEFMSVSQQNVGEPNMSVEDQRDFGSDIIHEPGPEKSYQSPPNIRDDFTLESFVGRQADLTVASDWIKNGRRLLSITAPPAIGKSWFLRRIAHLLETEQQSVLFIDLHNPPNSYIDQQSDRIKPEDMCRLLSEHFEEFADKKYPIPTKYDNDEIVQFMTYMGQVLGRDQGNDKGYFIFIDNCDFFDQDGWFTFEETFIEPLSRHPRIRFVIAMRDEHKISTFPLRWQEQRHKLSPLGETFGEKQITNKMEKLSMDSSKYAPLLIEKLKGIEYKLSHPGINRYILETYRIESIGLNPDLALIGIDEMQIDSGFLETMFALFEHVESNEVKKTILLLSEIADLEPEWTIETYRVMRGITYNEAWHDIDFLQRRWLVEYVEDNKLLLTMTLGWRPFFCEYNRTK